MPETKSPREIHLKSDKGEIDVFLCHDDAQQQQQQNQLSTSGDSLLDDIRPYVTPIVEKYLGPRNNENSKCIFVFCTEPFLNRLFCIQADHPRIHCATHKEI